MYPSIQRPLRPIFFGVISSVCGLLLASASTAARAYDWTDLNYDIFNDPGQWRLLGSPYMGHFRPSEEHQPVWALGVERRRDSDGRLVGAAYFSNSFGQPSAYLYVGRHVDHVFGVPQWTAQITGGLLYGYRGKYESKVPMNVNGFAPGLVVSTGWQFTKDFSSELHLLGDAGVMWQLSWRLR